MFLFALSALPSYGASDAVSGRLAPRRDERGFAPDPAAIAVGVLAVLARLDAGVSSARAEKSVSSSRRERVRTENPAAVSDSDDDDAEARAGVETKRVGPFVASYLGCLARHLRRFAARRGAGGARGYGGASSSIADALSAALVAATRASPSLGAGTSASPMSPLAGVFGGGGAAEAEEEASFLACAEWLETTCRLGQIPRRALYAHAPPYVLDNASTRWEE